VREGGSGSMHKTRNAERESVRAQKSENTQDQQGGVRVRGVSHVTREAASLPYMDLPTSWWHQLALAS
jgi:hypothetical protein